jgi:uncharacterized iron-regulated protein
MRWLAMIVAVWPACAMAQAGFDIVVLGEVHDNPAHHVRQAEIVAALDPAAVVWEMLPADVAGRVAQVGVADAAALGAALEWEALGWPDFAMYHPVFVASGEAMHVGAAVPDGDVRQAFDEGAAAVFGEGAAAYGLGPLAPDDQAAREAEQAEAHCGALPVEMLAGMVEVQRLRDAAFARAALAALASYGGPVVVITGTGHARADVGVPAAIRAARPDVTVWTLGQVEGAADPGAPFDAVNVTSPVDREDPCAVFE